MPIFGSSTKTTSPKTDCAWSVIEIVPMPVNWSRCTSSCSLVYPLAGNRKSKSPQSIEIEVAKRTTKHSELLWSGKEDAGNRRGSSPSVWVVGEAIPESCSKASLHSEGSWLKKQKFIHSSNFSFPF